MKRLGVGDLSPSRDFACDAPIAPATYLLHFLYNLPRFLKRHDPLPFHPPPKETTLVHGAEAFQIIVWKLARRMRKVRVDCRVPI